MKLQRVRGLSTKNLIRVFIQDSASLVGAGKTALTNASAALNISLIRELSASPTTSTTTTNIATIAALGTWVDPTAGKVRFKEIDSANMPGWYEVQFPDALFDNSDGSRFIGGTITGTGIVPCPFEIELHSVMIGTLCLTGTAVTGTLTQRQFTTTLSTYSAGQLVRRALKFTGGACNEERVLITGQTSGGLLTVAPDLVGTPVNLDTFEIF